MFHSSKIFLFTALFIILNVLSSMFFTRFDFTEGRIYTLSESTKQIVKELPEGIEIKAFISEDLPPQFITPKNQLLDKLDEYKNLSSYLTINYYDPVTDADAEELTQTLGIPPLDLQVVEKDQYQVVKAYFGLAVLKQKNESSEEDATATGPLADYEKLEVMPVIQSLDTFEYDLASMLLKVGSTRQPTVAFLEGHGEHGFAASNSYTMAAASDPRDDYTIQQELSRNYNVIQVDLNQEKTEGEESTNPLAGVDTLVIAGPTNEIPDEDITKIHEFIKNGGHGIFLIDSMNVDLQYSFSASVMSVNFDKLLEPWGVAIEPKLLADANSEMASFNQGFITYSLPYPYFAKVNNLNRDNSITRDLESFTLPWASPLNVTDKGGVNIEKIAYSSPYYTLVQENVVEVPQETTNEAGEAIANTETKTEPIDLNPQQNFDISNQEKDPVVLTVIAQKENEGKVMIVGDSDFLSQNFPENTIFFQNTVDSFTLGEALIQIRSKNVTDRPIEPLDETQKNTIKWSLIVGVPLLFVFYGIYRKWQRNNMKKTSIQ